MANDELPQLSLRDPTLTAALDAVCASTGFFTLVDHGIEASQFHDLRSTLRALFAVPDATKQRLAITPDNYRGFIPFGFFTPNRAEVSGAEIDRYEGYKLHWECPLELAATLDSPLYGPNRWPDEIPELRSRIQSYWRECERIAARLLDAFAPLLAVAASDLRSWHEHPLTNMTLLHYPPAPHSTGIHPHRDTNVLTLLHPGPVDGLEVRLHDGTWLRPRVGDEALIVNTGEMLELWSGGRYRATPHRVQNHPVADRFSFPWFLVPNHAVVVEPLVPCVAGFTPTAMPVGELSAEVWRTNWPDAIADSERFDLGSLDR